MSEGAGRELRDALVVCLDERAPYNLIIVIITSSNKIFSVFDLHLAFISFVQYGSLIQISLSHETQISQEINCVRRCACYHLNDHVCIALNTILPATKTVNYKGVIINELAQVKRADLTLVSYYQVKYVIAMFRWRT